MHSHIISFNFLYLGIIYQIIFKIPILFYYYLIYYSIILIILNLHYFSLILIYLYLIWNHQNFVMATLTTQFNYLISIIFLEWQFIRLILYLFTLKILLYLNYKSDLFSNFIFIYHIYVIHFHNVLYLIISYKCLIQLNPFFLSSLIFYIIIILFCNLILRFNLKISHFITMFIVIFLLFSCIFYLM